MPATTFPPFISPSEQRIPAPSVIVTDSPSAEVPAHGQTTDYGANWQIMFADADGIPLNMVSFDQIDFGAISYKEIFQNVKIILTTPLYSAALERLLGIDQTIVDRPINDAQLATIAILDALYFWEPRAQPVDIQFNADVLVGHLACDLRLNVMNVLFGTTTQYNRSNYFASPTKTPRLPPIPLVFPPPPPPPAGVARITTDGLIRDTTDANTRVITSQPTTT
jgi:hypothetical protein